MIKRVRLEELKTYDLLILRDYQNDKTYIREFLGIDKQLNGQTTIIVRNRFTDEVFYIYTYPDHSYDIVKEKL